MTTLLVIVNRSILLRFPKDLNRFEKYVTRLIKLMRISSIYTYYKNDNLPVFKNKK